MLIYISMEFNNETLRIAVKEYLENPEQAIIHYGPITYWNTVNVTDMSYMFCYAKSFDQPLNWNTTNVKNMYGMFAGATSFDQPLNWDTTNVTDMSYMFCDTLKFNQELNWDTSNVTKIAGMFHHSVEFNQTLYWNVGKIVNKLTIPKCVVPSDSFILL